MAENPDWLKDYSTRPTNVPVPLPQQKAQADITQSGASAAQSTASAKRTEALLPAEQRQGLAQAIKAEAEAEEVKRAAEEAEKARERAKQFRVMDLEGLLYNVQQARKNIGFLSTRAPGQILQGVWGTSSRDLASSLQGVKAPIVLEKLKEAKSQSQTGASGFGALSDKELGLLAGAIANVDQSQSPEQLMENLNRVEYHFRRAQALINGVDPDTPEGRYAAGLARPPEAQPTPSAEGEVEAGKREADIGLAGVNTTVRDMIKAGRTEEQIKEWLNSVQPELGNKAKYIQENINYWKQGGEPEVDIESVFKPTEGATKALGEALSTPLGSAATGFTSGYTSGFMDELTGNQPQSEATMRYLQERNPLSYLLGEMGGGIAQYATGARLLKPLMARYSLTPSATLGNVAQSALYGAGTAQPGERLSGAVKGAGTGFLGSKAGEAGTAAIGKLVGGAGTQGAQYLSRQGVPMTTGQITGGMLKRTEDRLAGLPVIGDVITQRRKESFEGFNRAAFNEALAPLGTSVDDIGVPGVAKAQEAVNQAYTNALGGLILQGDQSFLDNVFQKAYPNVKKIPRVGDELAGQVDDIIKTHFDPNTGEISGEGLQIALRELRDLRNSYKADPQFGSRIAPRLSRIEDAFDDLIERQAPDRAGLFKNANEAYKRVEIIGDAVDFAPAANAGIFTPDLLYRKSREVTRRFSGKRASRRGEKPFEQLTQAGRTELPSQIPESGTAGRMIIPLAAGSLLGGGTYVVDQSGKRVEEESDLTTPALMTAAGALLAGAPYSRTGQRALQTMLTAERPRALESLGQFVFGAAPYVGAALRPSAAGMGIDTIPSPEVSDQIFVNPQATRPQIVDEDEENFILSDGTKVPKNLAAKPMARGGRVSKLACK